MKLKLVSKIFVSTLLVVGSITFGSVFSNKQNKNYEASEAAIPSGYYSSVTDSMSGSTLLSTLKTIINTSSVSVSYDWSRYEDADEDPNNTSNVILVYARNSVSKSAHVSGSTGWNREHTFPASKLSNTQAEKDNHIIYASDNKVNGARSNIKMGVVSGGTVVNDYNGNPTTCRKTSSLFDPNNRARGIVARTTMYAAAMYEYDPEDNFESIATMLRWHLEYEPDSFDLKRNETVYTNQHNRNPFVDHPEYACRIWGNTNSTTQSICQAATTGISSISKTSIDLDVDDTTTISATSSNSGTISWSSSNTSVATVSSATAASGSSVTITAKSAGTATITASITISGTTYSKTCTVTVTDPSSVTLTSISVSTAPTKTSYTVGEYFDPTGLVITRNYSNSTSSTYTYAGHTSEFSFNPSTSTALATNNTSVTITYGGQSCNQAITVSSGGGGSGGDYVITYTDLPSTYQTGSTIYTADSGIKFQAYNCANYSSKMQFKASGGYLQTTESLNLSTLTINNRETNTLTVYGSNTAGTFSQTITGTNDVYDLTGYNYLKIIRPSSGAAYCSSITITTSSSGSSTPTLSSIAVQTAPTKTTYTAGEYFDPTGLVITKTYSDSSSETYTYANHTSEFSFTPSTSTALATNNTSVTIGYGGKSCEQEITVNAAKTLSSITISGYTTSFTEGDDFAFGGTVTANYSDSTSSNVTASASFSGYNMATVGQQTVTVTYSNKSTTYNITVGTATLDSITLSGQTTAYSVNDSFAFTGTCTAHFKNNNYSKNVTPTSVSSPDMSSSGEKTITVSFTYNGVTKTAQYTINVSSYTGVINSGRYYILNSTEAKGLAGAQSTNTPSAITVSSTECGAFDFTLVANDTYEISVTISSTKYYLVNNDVSTSGYNTKIRVINDPSTDLKTKYWTISTNGDGYYLKHNTTGSTNRTLACYNTSDWRGYTGNSGDQEIHLVAEGSKVASTVTSINNLTCNNGVTPPSTSSWSSIATAYGNISILSEKNYFKNTTANQLGTSIQQAAAKYDYIVGKYGTSSYSDFANRNPSPLNSGAILKTAQINSNTLITVISTLSIVSLAGFGIYFFLKKKKHNEE